MPLAVVRKSVVDGGDNARIGESRGAHGHRRRPREENSIASFAS